MNIAASDLIGTWILQSAFFRFEDDGESVEFYGARPTGVATFTKEGRLIAILSSGDRPATGDDASKARLFDAAMAYSGKFEVSGETFTTIVDAATIPEWLGSRQLRYIAAHAGAAEPAICQPPRSRHADMAARDVKERPINSPGTKMPAIDSGTMMRWTSCNRIQIGNASATHVRNSP